MLIVFFTVFPPHISIASTRPFVCPLLVYCYLPSNRLSLRPRACGIHNVSCFLLLHASSTLCIAAFQLQHRRAVPTCSLRYLIMSHLSPRTPFDIHFFLLSFFISAVKIISICALPIPYRNLFVYIIWNMRY